MSRPRKTRHSQVPPTEGGAPAAHARPSQDAAVASDGRWQPWFLVAAVTLLAARPLFPSEGADRGDGLPVVMLWLAWAVMWWLFQVGRPSVRVRFGLPDAAVLVLTAAYVVSGVVAVFQGTARPAINMLWEAVGFALVFLSLRQFVWTARRVRAVLGVMVAVAVGLAAYGLYQYGVEMPAVRSAYRRDPARYLELAGLGEYRNQPEALRLFENRFFSVEPLATFALTNSLAGFLLPWGIVLLAAAGETTAGTWPGVGRLLRRLSVSGECRRDSAADNRVSSAADRNSEGGNPDSVIGVRVAAQASGGVAAIFRAVLLWAGVFALGLCLILTKSRAAYLAAAFGVIGLLWSRRAVLGRRVYSLAVVGGAAVALLVGLAFALGGLDPLVFYEAGKSLLFRRQYWQATWRLILAQPWLGCGPGNFRFAYARFKLPDATEDISDPHNFLLEVWSAAGTFAVAALLVLLAFFFLRVRRRGRPAGLAAGRIETATRVELAPAADAREARWPTFALVTAWPLGWALSLLSSAPQTPSSLLVGLPAALTTLWALGPWVRGPARGGEASSAGEAALCGLAAAVLLIHWSVSGGWSFAAVSQSFWLLAAVGLSWAEDATGPRPTRPAGDFREAPGLAAYGMTAVFAVLTLGCYATAYAPVLRCRAWMDRVPRSDWDPRPALAALEAAAQADPLAVEPLLRRLSVLNAAVERGSESVPPGMTPGTVDPKSVRDDLDRTAARLRELSPNSDSAAFSVALAYLRAAELAGDPDALRKAELAARRAFELQPSQVLYRARLADILEKKGASAEAAREAEAALRQDDAINNAERKLPEEWRRKMETLSGRR